MSNNVKNANHTLYAQWTAKTYTITFNYNGGSGSVKSKTVKYNSKYGTLPSATRTGYSFAGWYTSGGVRVTADTVMNQAKNPALIAKWVPNNYLIITK